MRRNGKQRHHAASPTPTPLEGHRLQCCVAVSIVFAAERAAWSYSCYGDNWADGTSWTDNMWWGDGCIDSEGEMLRMVQLIVNETSTGQGCWTGTPDGDWGPATKAGVTCFQSWKGLTADGIVGGSTWGHRAHSPYAGLMSELNYSGSSTSTWVRYDLDLSGGYLRAQKKTSTGLWYVVHNCASIGFTYYEMGQLGPYSPSCW